MFTYFFVPAASTWRVSLHYGGGGKKRRRRALIYGGKNPRGGERIERPMRHQEMRALGEMGP